MKPEILNSERAFDGAAVHLRIDTIKQQDGSVTTREVIEHSEAVAVLAFDDERNVLLVKQWRHPLMKDLLEIPAGCVEPGEDPDETVVRELQEETGYKPLVIKKLGGYYSAPGFTNEYLHIYVASNLVESRLHAEDTDEIEVIKVPYDEFANMIRRREIEDAKSFIALCMVQNKLLVK
jgi:ADP-ribose pyrophosphatase